MSFLRFASDEVLEMARTLENSGGHMKSASKNMSRSEASQVGTPEMHSACDEFADSWDYGFGQLSKMTKGISKYANKVSEEFTKLDNKLYDELQKAREERKK